MKKFVYICVAIIITSCGGTKKITSTTSAEDITTARLIDSYYANTLDFKTMDARTRVRYDDGKNSQSVTVSIRIEKDKKIWLNASLIGITGARALITPDKVQFYDKLNGQYFDGDFEFLSQYLGIDIDFTQLQRLLTGQVVYDLRKDKYDFEETETGYTVTPRKKLDGINVLFFINSQNFMVEKQRVEQPADEVALDVAYGNYKTVGGKPFPTKIDILAKEGDNQTKVGITFRNIDLDKDLRFPFSIPSGFKEIQLDAK